MRAKDSSVVAVTVPQEMRAWLERKAEARGETLSLIVRDLIRGDMGGRREQSLPASVSPASGNFR